MASLNEDVALRELIVISALPALIKAADISHRELRRNGHEIVGDDALERLIARRAWRLADAIIAARAGETPA